MLKWGYKRRNSFSNWIHNYLEEWSFVKILNHFNPDVVIYDYQFPQALVKNVKVKGYFNVFIGLDYDKHIGNILMNYEHLFNLIILPCFSKKAIRFPSSKKYGEVINDSKKIKFTGPIVREQKSILNMRKKYGIKQDDFLIVVTGGGGGEYPSESGHFCESPNRVYKTFIDIFPELKKRVTNLKTIIVLGDFFGKNMEEEIYALKDLQFTNFEPCLLELIKEANLVISTAGYNICNELQYVKTPSLLVPVIRDDEDQFSRALELEKKGVTKVIRSFFEEKFLKEILDVCTQKKIDKMKTALEKNNFKIGNNKAVKEILKLLH